MHVPKILLASHWVFERFNLFLTRIGRVRRGPVTTIYSLGHKITTAVEMAICHFNQQRESRHFINAVMAQLFQLFPCSVITTIISLDAMK